MTVDPELDDMKAWEAEQASGGVDPELEDMKAWEAKQQTAQPMQQRQGEWKSDPKYPFKFRDIVTPEGVQTVQREDGALWFGQEQGNKGTAGWFDAGGNRAYDVPASQRGALRSVLDSPLGLGQVGLGIGDIPRESRGMLKNVPTIGGVVKSIADLPVGAAQLLNKYGPFTSDGRPLIPQVEQAASAYTQYMQPYSQDVTGQIVGGLVTPGAPTKAITPARAAIQALRNKTLMGGLLRGAGRALGTGARSGAEAAIATPTMTGESDLEKRGEAGLFGAALGTGLGLLGEIPGAAKGVRERFFGGPEQVARAQYMAQEIAASSGAESVKPSAIRSSVRDIPEREILARPVGSKLGESTFRKLEPGTRRVDDDVAYLKRVAANEDSPQTKVANKFMRDWTVDDANPQAARAMLSLESGRLAAKEVLDAEYNAVRNVAETIELPSNNLISSINEISKETEGKSGFFLGTGGSLLSKLEKAAKNITPAQSPTSFLLPAALQHANHGWGITLEGGRKLLREINEIQSGHYNGEKFVVGDAEAAWLGRLKKAIGSDIKELAGSDPDIKKTVDALYEYNKRQAAHSSIYQTDDMRTLYASNPSEVISKLRTMPEESVKTFAANIAGDARRDLANLLITDISDKTAPTISGRINLQELRGAFDKNRKLIETIDPSAAKGMGGVDKLLATVEALPAAKDDKMAGSDLIPGWTARRIYRAIGSGFAQAFDSKVGRKMLFDLADEKVGSPRAKRLTMDILAMMAGPKARSAQTRAVASKAVGSTREDEKEQ